MPHAISQPRRELLLGLPLCTAADLRRAGRRVRRLARDLPPFDSVWLDALVQLGRLTPFQARALEADQSDRLCFGRFLLTDRLGGGTLGETFLARRRRGPGLYALKRLRARASQSQCDQSLEELARLVEALRGLAHSAVAPALALERSGDDVALVSPFVSGLALNELVIRRGRFPPPVVWEIGRQLADGLGALAARGVTHGDLRTANVRLTAAGNAVLVDTGIRAALDTQLSIHSGLPPDHYDGVAPELIGRIARPDQQSDLYALGCLLWQLLSGRPPFPAGDPLVKLAAHQTRTIEDVRRWAPETPRLLAEGIRRLTARAPEERPSGFEELLRAWGPPTRRGGRRLAAFRRWFDHPPRPAPELGRRRSARPRWPAVAGLALVGAALAWALNHQGARSILMAWRAPAATPVTEPDALPADGTLSRRSLNIFPPESDRAPLVPADREDWQPLPEPDALGVLELRTNGPFAAAELTAVGPLSIIGAEGTAPEIIVGRRPLRLVAESVTLRNVRIRGEAGASDTSRGGTALVLVQSQSLEVEQCRLQMDDSLPDAAQSARRPAPRHALSWKLLDENDREGARAACRHTVFVGGDAALCLIDPAPEVELTNCLRLGGSAVCQWACPLPPHRALTLRLHRLTCRGTDALLRLTESPGNSGTLAVEAQDCVLDLSPDAGRLLELPGDKPPTEGGTMLRLTGEGSLVPPGLTAAVLADPHRGTLRAWDDAPLTIEGLSAGPFAFAGAPTLDPADSVIRDYEAPSRGGAPPGIRAAEIPR